MLSIPFYKNLKDNSHCFQSCLKMLLKYYFPKKQYSFSYLDKKTSHKKNKWTWNSAPLLFLEKLGFTTINIENFDYKQFAQFGDEYLKMLFTEEIFKEQKKYSDLKKERLLAKKLIKNKKINLQRRYAQFNELAKLFKKKYLLLVPINAMVLDKKNGYSSHIVLITDINKKQIIFHDPGLPPYKNRIVTTQSFKKAMQYPYKEAASIIAIKYIKKGA